LQSESKTEGQAKQSPKTSEVLTISSDHELDELYAQLELLESYKKLFFSLLERLEHPKTAQKLTMLS